MNVATRIFCADYATFPALYLFREVYMVKKGDPSICDMAVGETNYRYWRRLFSSIEARFKFYSGSS